MCASALHPLLSVHDGHILYLNMTVTPRQTGAKSCQGVMLLLVNDRSGSPSFLGKSNAV